MKKLLILLSVITLSISCSKDKILDSNGTQYKTIELNSMFSDAKQNNIAISGVTTFNDIMHFESPTALQNAVNNLETMQDNESVIFFDTYYDSSEPDFTHLDVIAENINFDEENIFEQFENQLSFVSLRSKIKIQEDLFLENANANWEENPINHFLGTPVMFTIFNEYNEIMIGDLIYTTHEDGRTLRISNSDYEAVLALRDNFEEYTKLSNVELVTDENLQGKNNAINLTNGSCRMNKNRDLPDSYATNKKIQKFAGIVDIGLFQWAYARNTHYSKKDNKWKKSNEYLEVRVDAAIVKNYGCAFYETKYNYKVGNGQSKYTQDLSFDAYIMQAIEKNGCVGNYKAGSSTLSPLYVTW